MERSRIRDFDKVENGDSCVVVGVVSKITKKKDKNKNQYAFVVMYTADGVLELTCWSSQYAEYQNMLVKDNKLAILCNKKDDKAFISKVKPYNQWICLRTVENETYSYIWYKKLINDPIFQATVKERWKVIYEYLVNNELN